MRHFLSGLGGQCHLSILPFWNFKRLSFSMLSLLRQNVKQSYDKIYKRKKNQDVQERNNLGVEIMKRFTQEQPKR